MKQGREMDSHPSKLKVSAVFSSESYCFMCKAVIIIIIENLVIFVSYDEKTFYVKLYISIIVCSEYMARIWYV